MTEIRPAEPAAPPAPEFSSLRGRALITVAALGTVGAVTLLTGGLTAVEYLIAQGLADEPGSTSAALDWVVPPHRVLIGAQYAALPVTVFAFLFWFYRARVNLNASGAQKLFWPPVASWLGWLVPIANLVIPSLMTAEVLRASRRSARAPWLLVGAWWASWIASIQLERELTTLVDTDPDAAAVSAVVADRAANLVEPALRSLATAVAAVLAILIVRRITRDQHARFAVDKPN